MLRGNERTRCSGSDHKVWEKDWLSLMCRCLKWHTAQQLSHLVFGLYYKGLLMSITYSWIFILIIQESAMMHFCVLSFMLQVGQRHIIPFHLPQRGNSPDSPDLIVADCTCSQEHDDLLQEFKKCLSRPHIYIECGPCRRLLMLLDEEGKKRQKYTKIDAYCICQNIPPQLL